MYIFRSGDISIANVDEGKGNTGEVGRWFFRIEDYRGTVSPREKCIAWQQWHSPSEARISQLLSTFMPCPCSFWQAWLDGRYWFSWFTFCAYSRFFDFTAFEGMTVFVYQKCCYSRSPGSFGALMIGPLNGGHVSYLFPNSFLNSKRKLGEYTDSEAYDYCCRKSSECQRFYNIRPSRSCFGYRPPIISKSLFTSGKQA